MVDPESSDLLSLTAVPYLGEVPYIEDLEAKRFSLADLFEEKLDLRLMDIVLPRR
jgi:hypothetical protein